jgi:hypothetical protein
MPTTSAKPCDPYATRRPIDCSPGMNVRAAVSLRIATSAGRVALCEVPSRDQRGADGAEVSRPYECSDGCFVIAPRGAFDAQTARVQRAAKRSLACERCVGNARQRTNGCEQLASEDVRRLAPVARTTCCLDGSRETSLAGSRQQVKAGTASLCAIRRRPASRGEESCHQCL